jgi:hypothetical protein
MQPVWTRLSRDDAHQVLNKLSGQRDAVVFSKEATEVAWRALPFYTNYRLYRLINYATMPTFSMTYVSNGQEFLPVDGTAHPIYAANQRDPISMTEMNVVPYLDFFFANVQGSEGDVFLIKDPKRMPFMDSLTPQQQQTVSKSFRPLSVIFDATDNVYRVTGTLYYGGGLISATIIVQTDGRLAFAEQNMLLSGIYFPHSPYTQQWAEG